MNSKRVATSALRDMLQYLAVLAIILSSGSMFFTVMNVMPTLFALLGISIVTVLVNGIKKQTFLHNLCMMAAIAAVVALNMVLNHEYAVVDNNIIILLIRLVSLVLIQSSISGEQFIKKYVKIMYALAIISLVCFAYTMLINHRLPFLIERSINGRSYWYTFYHTVGYRIIYGRNAGIFWEAPAYAIFISIALMFVVCRPELFGKAKKLLPYYIVFSGTVLTTLSVYAFMFLGVVAVLMLVSSNQKRIPVRPGVRKRRRTYYILGFVLLIGILVYMEIRFGLITHKLVNRRGSFFVRMNDTYQSVKLALKRLITGYGVFNNYTSGYLRNFGVENNSNGLAILLMAIGLPALAGAAGAMLWQIKKLLKVKRKQLFIIAVLFFLFHFSEHLWLYTLFISFLFRWQGIMPVNRRYN